MGTRERKRVRPNPTCPVCDHGATDVASVAAHNARASDTGCRAYPSGRYQPKRTYSSDEPIRPAAWLNREFGAFAPALLGRVPEGER